MGIPEQNSHFSLYSNGKQHTMPGRLVTGSR
uniref:Uncharacterized protein n=1 Tax=Anguilla anguilla TaxID=7936 RepID=A0A0E9RTG7_ANGAN